MPTNINSISQAILPLSNIDPSIQSPNGTQTNFADTLKATIDNMNDVQLDAELKTEALTKGEIDKLHEVMIAAQKASITIETTVQIQRKVIDAYNEVMRMQV